MPGSTATEVTLQLLLQGAHRWVYRAPARARPRPTNTALLLQPEAAASLEGIAEGIAEDDGSRAPEMLELSGSIAEETLEEEYDEEEVQESSPSSIFACKDIWLE